MLLGWGFFCLSGFLSSVVNWLMLSPVTHGGMSSPSPVQRSLCTSRRCMGSYVPMWVWFAMCMYLEQPLQALSLLLKEKQWSSELWQDPDSGGMWESVLNCMFLQHRLIRTSAGQAWTVRGHWLWLHQKTEGCTQSPCCQATKQEFPNDVRVRSAQYEKPLTWKQKFSKLYFELWWSLANKTAFHPESP